MRRIILALVFLSGIILAGQAWSEELTPALCKQKVAEAAQLIEAQGAAALPKLMDKSGPFIFADGKGYLFVQDINGVTLAHIKPDQIGKSMMDVKDANGSYFFMNINELAKKEGAGWVGYVWPKPGEKKPSPKVTYIKKAVFEGTTYVIGSGVYDVTTADIKKLFPKDPIFQE